MKNCTDCKYAEWDKTKIGHLHPSGDGCCEYIYVLRPLPASYYWIGGGEPKPFGGNINRKDKLRDHCVYYSEK